jgi:hypothetical protein
MLLLALAACHGTVLADRPGHADPADTGDTAVTDDRPVLDCRDRTTYEGLPYCLTTIGLTEVKLFVPEDRDPNAPMAVFLHGDTANGYYEDWGYEYLVPWALEHGIVFAAVLAPNGCSWWRNEDECTWETEDTDGTNADALHQALVTIGAAEDASTEGVRYVGYSGGSTFLTGHWLPLYGDQHPGTIVANCGGEVPIYDFAWDTRDAAIRDRDPIFYTYGSNDFMQEYIDPAVRRYTGLGFDVTTDERAGYEHCDAGLDWDGITLDLWEADPP